MHTKPHTTCALGRCSTSRHRAGQFLSPVSLFVAFRNNSWIWKGNATSKLGVWCQFIDRQGIARWLSSAKGPSGPTWLLSQRSTGRLQFKVRCTTTKGHEQVLDINPISKLGIRVHASSAPCHESGAVVHKSKFCFDISKLRLQLCVASQSVSQWFVGP